jgi:hypothetical protein
LVVTEKNHMSDVAQPEKVRLATIDECANLLAREYPDNANTNAFCAAIRSLAAQPPATPVETGHYCQTCCGDGKYDRRMCGLPPEADDTCVDCNGTGVEPPPRSSAGTGGDILSKITAALTSDSDARRDEALDAAYVEIERLRIEHDNRSKLNHARAKIIEECMDMLADVPGDGLVAKLTDYIGSYMALQIKVSDVPQTLNKTEADHG